MSEAPQVARVGPVRDGLARVVDEMERRDIDVLLLGREANARFVSGAARLWLAGTRPFAPGCVVVRATGDVHLLSITDDGVPASIPVAHLYSITWNPMKLVGAVAAIPGVADARRIGVDGLSPLFAQLLTGTFPAAELMDGNDLMCAVRRVKTADEVSHIRAAVVVAERALAAAVESLSPTVEARALTGIALEAMARQGVTTPAFEPVFTIDVPRDLVTARLGVLARGWEGSLARTYVLATGAPRTAPRGWDDVLARCAPGTRVAGLRPARAHGVGMGYEALEERDVLEPGMVVAVELAADGGLIADQVHITSAGHERLSS
jgi:Xaa-Pro aminopeptidase